MIFVFLALSAQYESWILPMAIILIVPLAVPALAGPSALATVMALASLATIMHSRPATRPMPGCAA